MSSAVYQRSPRSAYQALSMTGSLAAAASDGRRTFQYTTWYAPTASVTASCTATSSVCPVHHHRPNAASTIGCSENSTAWSQCSPAPQRLACTPSSFVTNSVEATASAMYTPSPTSLPGAARSSQPRHAASVSVSSGCPIRSQRGRPRRR